ncbi:Phosphatidylinositol-glycan biosynthesis class S protein [Neofusicoccum parvum]|uniref:Phosphatidylinositol-glycan biosynthesis class S protein n=1 Tax=Neofusicoccum parvum TaxID=310453 RepID=A0ACB5S6S8_9PEZI|nr:Phosphatidylinositol-glycan biosynthesis class S protein [Neofusicoccum parvum]GME64421.1 Phosphatidylinositol-glycan biosynthesis class S protein [Neofusicoccum parvum]
MAAHDPDHASSEKADDAPQTAVDAASVITPPPPESSASITTRRLVIMSFWAVAILLGLPLWFKTTTIYRADLPLQQMLDWADGKTCRPVFPLRIAIDAPVLPEADAHHLLRTTQHALDDLNDFSAHHLRLLLADPPRSADATQPSSPSDIDIALTLHLIPAQNGPTPRAELRSYEPILDVYYTQNQIPSPSSTSSPLATFLANELQSIFSEEQAALAYLLSGTGMGNMARMKSLSPETAAALERQKTRSFKYAPTYHLTFSLFTPGPAPSGWEIEAALDEYISPLLHSLSTISNFTIDTQVQLYATFAPSIREPEFDQEKNAWTLHKEDLTGFINAAEWPLSPSIGAGPTVNFVLYVPSESQSPMVVKENGGNSWLVPQWGGVLILNPPKSSSKNRANPPSLDKEALRPAMLTFSNQLLSLLGVPQSPDSLPLRITTLTRIRAASLLFSASSTLGSLARLTQALPSIAIPDNVAISVKQTIAHLHAACDDLREGKFHSALEHARVAEAGAEKAFFERSMARTRVGVDQADPLDLNCADQPKQ